MLWVLLTSLQAVLPCHVWRAGNLPLVSLKLLASWLLLLQAMPDVTELAEYVDQSICIAQLCRAAPVVFLGQTLLELLKRRYVVGILIFIRRLSIPRHVCCCSARVFYASLLRSNQTRLFRERLT